jgi:hypothetical protein
MRNLIYRILQALVLLAVAASLCHADNFMYFKKKAAAGGGGPTVFQSETSSDGASTRNDASGARLYIATRFQASKSTTISQVGVYIYRENATQTMNVDVQIFSDTAAAPVARVGNISATQTLNSMPTAAQEVVFTGQAAAITSGTYYWVVIHISATPTSSWLYWTTSTTGAVKLYDYSGDGSAWSNDSSTITARFNLYEG